MERSKIKIMEIKMINYNKLMEKLKEKKITTYTIRQKCVQGIRWKR